jgi:hypothetical protein
LPSCTVINKEPPLVYEVHKHAILKFIQGARLPNLNLPMLILLLSLQQTLPVGYVKKWIASILQQSLDTQV